MEQKEFRWGEPVGHLFSRRSLRKCTARYKKQENTELGVEPWHEYYVCSQKSPSPRRSTWYYKRQERGSPILEAICSREELKYYKGKGCWELDRNGGKRTSKTLLRRTLRYQDTAEGTLWIPDKSFSKRDWELKGSFRGILRWKIKKVRGGPGGAVKSIHRGWKKSLGRTRKEQEVKS